MNEDLLIIRLRDCFTAGYTLPQFCIDNGIKKPLFVAIDERRADFLWEIFVQFKYDKRITPTFSLLNGKVGTLNFSVACILSEMKFESISNLNINEYDKIIFLNAERFNAQIPNAIYLDQLTDYFITRTYAEIPLLHFLQRHPKVNIVVTNYPILHLNEYSTEFEKRILKENIHQVHAKIEASNGKKIDTPLDFLGYTNEEVLELLDMTDAKTNPDGSTSLKNSASRLIGVDNGQRKTAYQPTNFQNKIYFMGTCTYFGIGTPFDKTLESYLQKIIIENNLPYRVENEGQFFSGRYQDIFYNLNNLPVVDGDIIFICLQALKTNGVPFFDVCSIFDRPHNYGEVFTDFDHLNEVGYKILAERFFQFLAQNNFFKNVDFHYPPSSSSSSVRYTA